MQYTFSLTIPPLTSVNTPAMTAITLHEPYITAYEIYFPPGCAGLARAALIVEGRQFAPSDGGGDKFFKGEGPKTWVGKYRLPTGKSESILTAVGYNDDDFYPHNIIFTVTTDMG